MIDETKTTTQRSYAYTLTRSFTLFSNIFDSNRTNDQLFDSCTQSVRMYSVLVSGENNREKLNQLNKLTSP